jgi:hypothetical protein
MISEDCSCLDKRSLIFLSIKVVKATDASFSMSIRTVWRMSLILSRIMVAKSCAIAHVVNCSLHTVEEVQSTPYQIFVGQNGAESGFSL